jgi:D-alanine-D-alanine ligase
LKVLVLYTLPPTTCDNGRAIGEFELDRAALNVASVLDGAAVVGVRGEAAEILNAIDTEHPDVIFNVCEAPLGKPALEAHAAALFEWIGIPFTGSSSQTLALCRNKPRMNALLAANGVAVPRGGIFPAIVKPADEDGSAGIDADAICEDAAAVQRASARWPGAVVVQEFLHGREFAISVWGNRTPDHISIGETLFQNGLRLNTYAAKWDPDSDDFADSPLDYRTEMSSALRTDIAAAVRGAWHTAGARGYLRVDVRCDANDRPFVLDVNPNPELGPAVGICRAVQEAGWTWECFVRRQVEWACDR